MQDNCPLSHSLRPSITAIVAGCQTRQQINDFVAVCHALATTFLRRKIASAMLQSRLHYSSYQDMAYDCIADLFRQDENGVLKDIKVYFDGVDMCGSDEEELLSHVRRLIASKVSQGLFRIYSDVDPAFGKILRNIKLAIHSLGTLDLSTRFGDWYICPTATDTLDTLPECETDTLERELRQTANGNETVPQLLSKLSLCLRQQSEHSRNVRLTIVARVFKSIYVQNGPFNDSSEMDDRFTIPETEVLVRKVCESTKRQMRAKYVVRKKVDEGLFNDYFRVIELTSLQSLTGEDGDPATLYVKLNSFRPELTREEYYKEHRAVLEYLARVTYKRVVEELRKEV